jgi:hypothetical protein
MSIIFQEQHAGLAFFDVRKIRSFFLIPDETKMVNCVLVSAAAQYIEAPMNAPNTHPINQSGFCCQDLFFTPRLQYQASWSSPGGDVPYKIVEIPIC